MIAIDAAFQTGFRAFVLANYMNNLIAAGSLLVALPTIVVDVLRQRHFIRSLTLGASKG